jgi:hypothetical protein
LGLLQDIVAMSGMLTELEAAEASARVLCEAQKPQRNALRLPAIGNLKARCDAFAQKAGHVINTLEEITTLFYGKELTRKWIDSLTTLAAGRYGKDSPFAQYMESARPFLLFVLGMRNMIEHPTPDKHIQVNDFRLLTSGQIAPPAVEVMRPGEDLATATITLLMKKVIDDLVSVSEMLMAHLCSVNVGPVRGDAGSGRRVASGTAIQQEPAHLLRLSSWWATLPNRVTQPSTETAAFVPFIYL